MYKTVILGSQRKSEQWLPELERSSDFRFTGFYDPDDSANADPLGQLMYGMELAQSADVFIVDRHVRKLDASFLHHITRSGCHVLFDGYHLQECDEASELLKLQNEGRNCIHIGNVLYNQPLFTTANQYIRKPRLIRIEKHCTVPQNGHFKSWFYKNLAEEMDILLRISQSNVRHITARPLFLFGDKPDLLNIHIEFDNDSICNIAAGRAIKPGTHRFRIFQQDKLYDLNFTENRLLEYRQTDNRDQLSFLEDDEVSTVAGFTEIERPVMPFDVWKTELRNFSENISKSLTPISSMEEMVQVSFACQSVTDKVQRRYMEV